MKYSKKILSFFLVFLMVISLVQISFVSSSAVVKFESGDFEFALVDDNTIEVSAYLGDKTAIELPETVEDMLVTGVYSECFKDSNITSVEFPNIYTNIGKFAFQGCKSLTKIKMPTSLESVGTMAFYDCENLEFVDFTGVSSFQKLAFAMFSGCKNLGEINLPESVTSLNENVFVNCESLTKVTFSDKIKVIPEYAFYGCTSLCSIELPSGLTKIEDYAFANNTLLDNVDLPASLATIGEGAFENDAALSNLFISDTVSSIGANAFSDNTSITCYTDSYAEEYCEVNSLNYTAVEKLMGDSNLDGVVNINDVTTIQLYLVGHEELISTYRAKELSNVYKDGKISIRDATMIQMYLAGIIAEL